MSHVNSSAIIAKDLPPNVEGSTTPPRNQPLERSTSMPRIVPKLNLHRLNAEGGSGSPSKIQNDAPLSPTGGEKAIEIGEPVLLQKTTVKVASSQRILRTRSHRASSSPTKLNRSMTLQSEVREPVNSLAKHLSPRKLVTSLSQHASSFVSSLKDRGSPEPSLKDGGSPEPSQNDGGSPEPSLKELFNDIEWTVFSSPGHESIEEMLQRPLVRSPISERSLKRKSDNEMGADRKKIRLSTLPFPPTDLAKHAIESRQQGKPWIGKASGNSIAGRLQETLEKLFKANAKQITPEVYMHLQQLFGLLPAGATEEETTFTYALKQSVVNLGLNDTEWRAIETLHQNFDELDLSSDGKSYAEFKSQLGKIITSKNELLSEKE